MKRLISTCYVMCLALGLYAQPEQDFHANDNAEESLQDFFRKGVFTAHTRSYFMGTINRGILSDYYALTTGAGIGYVSPEFKGFGIGLNGFFIFRISSSPLEHKDPLTGKLSRYELGLLDVKHPDNGEDLDRLEEAYIFYRKGKLYAKLGRMTLNTPFVNGQDSRMRPSLIEGVSLDYQADKNLKISSAWIWAVSPRSTISWFPLAESVGIYSSGQNTAGEASDYEGNLSSKGMFITGLNLQLEHDASLEVWNYFLDNISNTFFTQIEKSHATQQDATVTYALQAALQFKVADGGNENASKSYFESEHSEVFSTRVAWRKKKNQVDVNLSRITSSGRFLFPREWGREPFYTGISRERNEGAAKVSAASLNYLRWMSSQWNCKLSAGLYNMPDPNRVDWNKYGLRDYVHFAAKINYCPKGKWEGLECSALAVVKANIQEEVSLEDQINKTNLGHISLVLDYHFGKTH